MISVVVPLYNKEKSILSTLQSVLQQTMREFEIVVVDDGSTDNSVKVVEEMALSDDRICIVEKANGGVSSARNVGIQHAKYDFIAFLDADDLWEKNYLEEQQKLISDFPEAALWGTAWGHIEQGLKVFNHFKIEENFRGFVSDYWQRNLYLYWTSAVVVSKKAFYTVGCFDERISYGEDLDVWYRFILNFPVVFYNVTLSYYKLDAENRAMNYDIPLDKYLPFYIDKYKEYRQSNDEFRHYFDQECLYRLYPMLVKNRHNKELLHILNHINFSEFKFSLRWRFLFPRFYQMYLNLKNGRKENPI